MSTRSFRSGVLLIAPPARLPVLLDLLPAAQRTCCAGRCPLSVSCGRGRRSTHELVARAAWTACCSCALAGRKATPDGAPKQNLTLMRALPSPQTRPERHPSMLCTLCRNLHDPVQSPRDAGPPQPGPTPTRGKEHPSAQRTCSSRSTPPSLTQVSSSPHQPRSGTAPSAPPHLQQQVHVLLVQPLGAPGVGTQPALGSAVGQQEVVQQPALGTPGSGSGGDEGTRCASRARTTCQGDDARLGRQLPGSTAKARRAARVQGGGAHDGARRGRH